MVDWNRVTEKPSVPAGATLWLVSAEWRGGHDGRIIRLQNIHLSEISAREDWERLTPEAHNQKFGFADGEDHGFVRHPMRAFRPTPDV